MKHLLTILVVVLIYILVNNLYKIHNIPNLNKQPSIIHVFQETIKNHPKQTAIITDDGVQISYQKYYKMCQMFGSGLQNLGVQQDDTVVISGSNHEAWFVAHIGSMMAGCVPVGLYPTNSIEANINILEDCKPRVLVLENVEHYMRCEAWISENKDEIVAIIFYNQDLPDDSDLAFFGFEEFLKVGNPDTPPRFSKTATLIYTSGTTGRSKGVIISHTNIMTSLKSVTETIQKDNTLNIGMASERFLSYLPLNHIAAQMLDMYLPITIGGTVYIADKDALKSTLHKHLNLARPTIFAGVPRVWEKMAEKIKKGMHKRKDYERLIFDLSSYFTSILSDQVIEKIGLDQCKLCISTAAPINEDVREYFAQLGLNIYDIYGMSETTGPITLSTPSNYRYGSVGKALPHFKVKISKQGELLVKGNSVTDGYYLDPGNTESLFTSDGWMKTGDLAAKDSDGFLYIKGRSKELIVTSGGENIAPRDIEDKIKGLMPFVEDAVLIGDGRKYLIVLLTFNVQKEGGEDTVLLTNNAVSYFKQKKLGKIKTTYDALDSSKFKKHVNKLINQINESATSRAATIKKWTFLPDPFSQKGGEYTHTLKLKRDVVNQKYKQFIDKLY